MTKLQEECRKARKTVLCNTCRFCSHIDAENVYCDASHINGSVILTEEWLRACPDYSEEE